MNLSFEVKVSSHDGPMPGSDLLKQATRERDAGNLDKAVETLRQAYAEIAQSYVSHSVDTFLRLPLYLQKAGRNDEAWREFNLLLTQGFPNQIQNLELLPMEHSQIFDKMRLFLQREKKFDLAVRFGIWSYISWAIGLTRQRRNRELKSYLHKDNVHDCVETLVKKAKRTDLLEPLAALVINEIQYLPKIDIADFGRRIDEIVFTKETDAVATI